MKVFRYLIPLTIFFAACDDQITVELDEIESFVSIDAWLTNQPGRQVIRVQQTQGYFENTFLESVQGAQVTVTDDEGTIFEFLENENGEYAWIPPTPTDSFGEIGRAYFLEVIVDGVTYSAASAMNRVPEIDSVTFRFEEGNAFLEDSYFGEFWSRDPLGVGDTYWIKAYKNGVYLNKPDEINIAFDAGFSQGGVVDGLIFIQPIRDGVNEFEESEEDDGMIRSPYTFGDSLSVELHSISNDAFFFMQQVIDETNRPGGFGELFANPLSNVSTNISVSDPDVPVVGFFNVAAVNTLGRTLVDEDDVRIVED
ncbi:MAG: DUF4249 domain-containing protein [Bacteroidota bacterium]